MSKSVAFDNLLLSSTSVLCTTLEKITRSGVARGNAPGHEVSMDSGCEVEQPGAEQLKPVLFTSQGQGEVLVINNYFTNLHD